jgi:glycosyltransferase involved in cell wall biosynthesis
MWQALRADVDLVHVCGLELGHYALEVLRNRTAAGGPAVVLDEQNAEYVLQRRACLTDARTGVETERYAPVDTDLSYLPRFDMVFSGTLNYRPNIDAAVWLGRTVWPALRARLPDLTLGLVGQRPADAVRALAAVPGITVTGAVADDRPYLWGATLYAVPMRYGGGVRLKLLNALAAGCPVISTTMGAEGVAAVHGQHLLLANHPEQWVRGVARVRGEPKLREWLVEQGRALVRERYEWRDLVRAFGPVYEAALAGRSVMA